MTARRSAGKTHVARALWYVKPRVDGAALGAPPPGPGEALVRTLFQRHQPGHGAPRLQRIDPSKRVGADARAPSAGRFPFPVKYGYCATGTVIAGPAALVGRTVFCLHPHQDLFVAPLDMLVPVPEAVPPRRATLAATMETALNAHWDAGSGPADRIVVVGAGVVGLLVARLSVRIPGTAVTRRRCRRRPPRPWSRRSAPRSPWPRQRRRTPTWCSNERYRRRPCHRDRRGGVRRPASSS